MNADEARLQTHLDENPGDAASRQVLADLLEEGGRPDAAQFQRWLAARGLWPDSDLAFCGQRGWHWWLAAAQPHCGRAHAVVPPELHDHMPRGEWSYTTRGEAEAVLACALARRLADRA